jgi:hypothetical protein
VDHGLQPFKPTEGVTQMTIRNFVPVAAAFVVLGAAGLVMPHAFAQPMWDQVKVKLPYSVTLGEKTIPPGDYLIKQLESADGDSPVLLIYGKNGMKFQTSALTIHAVDVNTPQKTDVTLQHIGDNYYLDKVWIAGKNYGYEIPLPKNVKERATEAAAVSVPSEPSASSDTTSTTTTTTTSDTSSTVDNSTPTQAPAAEPGPPTPPPAPEPQPQATTDNTPQPQPAPPAVSDEGSANREKQPDNTPNMPATSAGWLAMLLSGGTLSGAGMMLRRRKQ